MNEPWEMFLSFVMVVKDRSDHLASLLTEVADKLSTLVTDYEIILVDNGSEDETFSKIRQLTRENGIANVQAYSLLKPVHRDKAAWAGIEASLGDFCIAFDPGQDDIAVVEEMIKRCAAGHEVIFAINSYKTANKMYRIASSAFDNIYRSLTDVSIENEASSFRLLSKRVVNYLLQFPHPSALYRHLPASSGFSRSVIKYHEEPFLPSRKSFLEAVDRGLLLLTTSSKMPMRLVCLLSSFGALANLLYSLYVVLIAIFKEDVAAGWVSMSLQQSGMFFLISAVLLVLGEYLLTVANFANEGPGFFIADELTSARMTRLEKLNIVSQVKVPQIPQPQIPQSEFGEEIQMAETSH